MSCYSRPPIKKLWQKKIHGLNYSILCSSVCFELLEEKLTSEVIVNNIPRLINRVLFEFFPVCFWNSINFAVESFVVKFLHKKIFLYDSILFSALFISAGGIYFLFYFIFQTDVNKLYDLFSNDRSTNTECFKISINLFSRIFQRV